MKIARPSTSFTPHEVKRFTSPASLGLILFLAVIALYGIFTQPERDTLMILYGIGGITYTLFFRELISRSTYFRERYSWAYSVSSGLGLGILSYVLPPQISELHHIIIVWCILGVTVASGRFHGFLAMGFASALSLIGNSAPLQSGYNLLEFITPYAIAVIVIETYALIKRTTQQHIHRLETINKVSRQLMQSLDTEQVLSLLSGTIIETLQADSYFIGILKDEQTLHLQLMYDEGEFFNGIELPLEGTLASWVIRNQRELFLPDLREEVELENVTLKIVGKDKTSLSWIGVPLKSQNITGLMAMASYTPNAFDLADMELLSTLAQHVTLALDNTVRHAQVEEQARLDSLTGVYNHGYFLTKLSAQAQEALKNQTPLSLIMLDIDFFKQYNDTYGHLVGDRILNSLCMAIKSHIKQGDAVGRWGGEEFIISLPNATGEQASQVARRISETMSLLRVEDRLQRTVPVPTVSQGVAIFPQEADEIYELIDLADRRLYTAKKRGRNQIEPALEHWSKN